MPVRINNEIVHVTQKTIEEIVRVIEGVSCNIIYCSPGSDLYLTIILVCDNAMIIVRKGGSVVSIEFDGYKLVCNSL